MMVPEISSLPAVLPWAHGDASHFYTAYGLAIRSALALPEFSRAERTNAGFDVNVVIPEAEEEDWISTIRQEESSWHVGLLESRFWFRSVGAFRIREGREIAVHPEPGADAGLLRLYVEGMMMATLLFQRGHLVLHASVALIDGRGVGFMGPVGAGKSSTVAALHARGHAVVSDDNAALDLSGREPMVTPAFPCLKVFPAIAESLGIDGLIPMHSSQLKRGRPAPEAFPTEPVPLDRIYLLTREPAPDFDRIHPNAAAIDLVRNSVPARWKLPGDARHLSQCASLAGRIPIYRVRTFDTLADLPTIAGRIEDHCRRLSVNRV